MPSINEIMERVAAVRPDAYDDSVKAARLIDLEGRLYREVILRHKLTPGEKRKGPAAVCPVCGGWGLDGSGKPREPEDGEKPLGIVYDVALDCSRCPACGWSELPKIPERFPEDADMPLLVEPPYDRLYELYLMAQIDFLNREYDNYNNSVTAFNDALDQWRQKYHRDHPPLDGGYYKNLT